MRQSDLDPYEEAMRARNRGDHARTFEIYERLAEDGDAYALVMLGSLYARGIGTPVDLAKAEELLERAARLGEPEARFQMAHVWHDRGDMQRYFLVIEEAARDDLLVARFYLGCCYAYGRGVAKDPVKALEIMRDAAERGHIRAKMYLARQLLLRPWNPLGFAYGLVKLLLASIEGLTMSLIDPYDERVR